MKNIIPVLATLAVVVPWAVFAQNADESVSGGSTAQNGNKEVQATSSERSSRNQNRRAVTEQQNQISSGSTIGRFGSSYGYRLHNVVSRFPATGENSLVVHSSDMSTKEEANLEEDLSVMAHILDKALEDLPSGQAHTRSAMGIDLFVAPNAGTTRNFYLEGYGALFLLNIGFPVVAPASAPQEEKPSGDSTWEEARQELYGQSGESQTVTVPGEEFSEEKVARLKEALLRALKNATNIRGLRGDITVCVLGGANSLPANRAAVLGGNSGVAMTQLLVANGEPPASHGTVLTLKVTKADVDAFAKGELKFADFQQRARIVAYTTATSASNGMHVGGFGGGGGVGGRGAFGGGGIGSAK